MSVSVFVSICLCYVFFETSSVGARCMFVVVVLAMAQDEIYDEVTHLGSVSCLMLSAQRFL